MSPIDQLQLLRQVCAETSQAEVARRIGYSGSAVCQVLSGDYNQGKTDRLLTKVEEIYGSSTVDCPGMGEAISLAACAGNRSRQFQNAAVNPEWVRMYKACRACPQNNLKPVKKEV